MKSDITSEKPESVTSRLLRRRDEISKRVPLTDQDLAEICAINRHLMVPS